MAAVESLGIGSGSSEQGRIQSSECKLDGIVYLYELSTCVNVNEAETVG